MKTAILILTHFWNQSMADLYRRIRAETSEHYDVFVALNLINKPLAVPEGAEFLGSSLYLCNHATLVTLPYPEKCNPEGWSGKGWESLHNADTIMLSFYRDHPEYSYYWNVEYDVHFEGRWGFLFEHFEASVADVLATTLRDASPDYLTLMPPFRDPEGNRPHYKDIVIGSYAFYRVSNRFLKAIDEDYQSGWNGHCEHVWGTAARRYSMGIEDIGGNGTYTKPQNKNTFYFNNYRRWDTSPGTFVFHPPFKKIHKHENTLWHPIKPQGDYFRHSLITHTNWRGQVKEKLKRIFYDLAIRAWFLFRWHPAE